MYPKLLTYPDIGSYSALLLLGFFAGFLIARRLARFRGIESRHVDNLTLIFLVVGLVGARLFARLFYMPQVGFWESFKLWEGGGLVFYGGLIFAIFSLFAYSRARHLPLRSVFDVFAPAAAIGLGFGRIGCFLAGCCWGDVCLDKHQVSEADQKVNWYQIQTVPALSYSSFPLAVQYPVKSEPLKQHVKLGLLASGASKSLPVHPVQLYEAAIAFLLAAWLYRSVRRRSSLVGVSACYLALGYACIRFVLEFFRGDNHPDYMGMTISQVISLLIGFVALTCVSRIRRSAGAIKANSAELNLPCAEAQPTGPTASSR